MTIIVDALAGGKFKLDVVHEDRAAAVYVNTAAEARLFIAQAAALMRLGKRGSTKLDVVGAELCR